MAILKFKADEVRRCVEHAKAAPKHRSPFGGHSGGGPHLWLAGDQGVYLMSSGDPGDQISADPPRLFVAYAVGINPEVDPFDEWWERKRETFGGDDGIEVLEGWLGPIQDRLDAGDEFIQIKIDDRLELL